MKEKIITLFIASILLGVIEAFWFQAILEHFQNEKTPYLTCFFILFVANLTNLSRFVFIALFVTQCYIWLF